MSDKLLSRGVAEVIESKPLEDRMKRGEKLRIKLGVDPTSPDIHLGHMVVINKLKIFQMFGHKIIFIIGDYTARIGDPSGKKKTRPILSNQEIEFNAKTYLKQVGKVLDMTQVEVVKNSKWFSRLSSGEWLNLLSKFTVAQIMERDDFTNRFRSGVDIGMHELIYPVMQAYDSVMVRADVEIGGTDQKFNMLAGRDLQKKMGMKPQDVITVPLLVGVDGKEKMSKSLGNAIGVSEKPEDIYGKTMSIPDELIMSYFTLATDLSEGGLKMVERELSEGANPRDVKARLAFLLVETYHDIEKANMAVDNFNRVCRDKQVPDDVPIKEIKKGFDGDIVDLIAIIDPTISRSEVKRLTEQSGIKLGKSVIETTGKKLKLSSGLVLQIGKRKFYKIKLV